MKFIFITLLGLLAISFQAPAQSTEKFDIVSFQTPKGWQRDVGENAVQFGVEKGTDVCIATIFKSLPAGPDPKANFDLAWEKIVKDLVTVSGERQMLPSETAEGWTLLSGLSKYQSDGINGVALLVNASGGNKMINVLILTNSDAFKQDIEEFLGSFVLPKLPATSAVKENPQLPPKVGNAISTGFQFNTSNFDDGWTSTVQENWVEAVKGTTKILIHFPTNATHDYNPDLLANTRSGWDILIASRYGNLTNFEVKSLSTWESVYFAEGDVVDNATGKRVHVVLFRKDSTGSKGNFLEFITPDKSSFEREFGAYRQSTSGWENVERMSNYNKFAVSPTDLKGKWSSKFSGSISYVYSATGNSAGMDTTASAENFDFGPGNSYKWDIGLASGMVGNIKFQSAKSSGKFSVPTNWQVSFTSIEGKPKTYDAYFRCVKGGRILVLGDKGFGKIE